MFDGVSLFVVCVWFCVVGVLGVKWFLVSSFCGRVSIYVGCFVIFGRGLNIVNLDFYRMNGVGYI